MAVPCTIVTSGGIPVSEGAAGMPLTPTDNAWPVTIVGSGGMPVVFVSDAGVLLPGGGGNLFTPSSLFANGENGFLFDPSQLSKMWQTSIASTSSGPNPVTTAAQSVGLILDTKQSATPGAELTTNGNFASSGAGWTNTAGTTFSVGQAEVATNQAGFFQSLPALAVDEYAHIQWTQTSANGPTVFLGTTSSGNAESALNAGAWPAGSYLLILKRSSSNDYIRFSAGALGPFTTTGVSVKKITGRHAIQTTAGARPTYQADGILRGDATDDNLLSTFKFGAAGNTIAARAVVPASIAASRILLGASGASTDRFFAGFNTSGNLCGGVGSDDVATVLHASDYRGQTGVLALREDGSNWTLHWNGAQVATGARNGAPTTTIPARILAYNNNGTAAGFAGMDVSDLLAINRALTPAEISSLATYWNA